MLKTAAFLSARCFGFYLRRLQAGGGFLLAIILFFLRFSDVLGKKRAGNSAEGDCQPESGEIPKVFEVFPVTAEALFEKVKGVSGVAALFCDIQLPEEFCCVKIDAVLLHESGIQIFVFKDLAGEISYKEVLEKAKGQAVFRINLLKHFFEEKYGWNDDQIKFYWNLVLDTKGRIACSSDFTEFGELDGQLERFHKLAGKVVPRQLAKVIGAELSSMAGKEFLWKNRADARTLPSATHFGIITDEALFAELEIVPGISRVFFDVQIPDSFGLAEFDAVAPHEAGILIIGFRELNGKSYSEAEAEFKKCDQKMLSGMGCLRDFLTQKYPSNFDKVPMMRLTVGIRPGK